MTRPGVCSKNSVLFLTPEAPALDAGGGALRSASLLAYLRARYAVEVVSFNLPAHSGAAPARIWRNAMRLVRGVPPLLDRYSGCEAQLDPFVEQGLSIERAVDRALRRDHLKPLQLLCAQAARQPQH